MDKIKHASIRIKSEDGKIARIFCSHCLFTYSEYELQHITQTGRCVNCRAIFDGEEKNEVEK